jgi:hypothetical protein
MRAKIGVQIYDYVDRGIEVLARMFEKRRQRYRAMGYAISSLGEAPQLALSYRPAAPGLARRAPRASDEEVSAVEPLPVPITELDAMIDDVLEGAFNPTEQAIAFLELLDDQLDLPMTARVGRSVVDVASLSLSDHDAIVATCVTATGRRRRIPLPRLIPARGRPLGWEWVDAHNRWVASSRDKKV